MLKTPTLASLFLIACFFSSAQTAYTVSFPNIVHHEATIKARFEGLRDSTAILTMSRSSPGRYALHEFAKNVYGVKAVNSRGRQLQIERPDPYSWKVLGHDGTVELTYTLFANRADGTYSKIDESQAHLNAPATFMFAPELQNQPYKVHFQTRPELKWKIATQLRRISATKYQAPNLHYFMDSPIELSNHEIRSFNIVENDLKKRIKFALHHNGTSAEFDAYFEQVKKIVRQQIKVFGELPDFDYNEYIFIASYLDGVARDGMEHRNSTILTSPKSLKNGGMSANIGTVSHEFFHAWNVERLRPKSLEPFDFSMANISGELWFAEGFTSYYTKLILCRANIISHEQYIESLNKTFNAVWTAPGTLYYNPIEMSYQAPFVDAAKSIDPVNRHNTFISYYSYGSVLGLALDLSLRNKKKPLNLDGYMRLLWNTYGKKELPYTIENLKESLKQYAGEEFGDEFFKNYIYNSKQPDYKTLFNAFGISYKQKETTYSGLIIDQTVEGNWVVTKPIKKNTPAYIAKLDKGDQIIRINGVTLDKNTDLEDLLKQYKVGNRLSIVYKRHGKMRKTLLFLIQNPSYTIALDRDNKNPKAIEKRNNWLNSK